MTEFQGFKSLLGGLGALAIAGFSTFLDAGWYPIALFGSVGLALIVQGVYVMRGGDRHLDDLPSVGSVGVDKRDAAQDRGGI
jgi:hypothetical protein